MARLSNQEARELLQGSTAKGTRFNVSPDKFKALGNGTSLVVNKAKEREKLVKRGVSPAPGEKSPTNPPKHKYNAEMVHDEVTGRKATKLEDKHAKEYRQMLKEGIIATYCQQVEIYLKSPRTGGMHKYICDHLLIYKDGRREYIDSKGVETPEYKKKANWMERQFLPENPGATFIARFSNRIHVYEAKPKRGK